MNCLQHCMRLIVAVPSTMEKGMEVYFLLMRDKHFLHVGSLLTDRRCLLLLDHIKLVESSSCASLTSTQGDTQTIVTFGYFISHITIYICDFLKLLQNLHPCATGRCLMIHFYTQHCFMRHWKGPCQL